MRNFCFTNIIFCKYCQKYSWPYKIVSKYVGLEWFHFSKTVPFTHQQRKILNN